MNNTKIFGKLNIDRKREVVAMTITLLVVDILLIISLIVAINIVKEKQQRLNAEIKHSLRLEETVDELVKLR